MTDSSREDWWIGYRLVVPSDHGSFPRAYVTQAPAQAPAPAPAPAPAAVSAPARPPNRARRSSFDHDEMLMAQAAAAILSDSDSEDELPTAQPAPAPAPVVAPARPPIADQRARRGTAQHGDVDALMAEAAVRPSPLSKPPTRVSHAHP